jgi:hypothetical protein
MNDSIRNQLGAALVAMTQPIVPNTPAPFATAAKAPKGKAEVQPKPPKPTTWQTALDKTLADLNDVCTAKQIETIELMVHDAYQRKDESDAWDVVMAQHVASLHPTGKVTAPMYFPIVAAIRTYFGPYAATQYRAAVRAMPGMKGKLPTKADKRAKGGTKGLNAKKWYAGVHTSVKGLVERFDKRPTLDVNAKVLRQFTLAYNALVEAEKALGKAVNE